MDMTQEDFEERAARVADGTADDEDKRLVKHYQREGFEVGADPADASWLFETADYSAMTKKELVAELEKRTDANGEPLVIDQQARNAALIEQLKANDVLRAGGE